MKITFSAPGKTENANPKKGGGGKLNTGMCLFLTSTIMTHDKTTLHQRHSSFIHHLTMSCGRKMLVYLYVFHDKKKYWRVYRVRTLQHNFYTNVPNRDTNCNPHRRHGSRKSSFFRGGGLQSTISGIFFRQYLYSRSIIVFGGCPPCLLPLGSASV